MGGDARARRSSVPRARDRERDRARTHSRSGMRTICVRTGSSSPSSATSSTTAAVRRTKPSCVGFATRKRRARRRSTCRASLLRRAQPNGAGLEVDGEPLTCERLKRAIEDVFADHEVEGSDMIVAHGPQTAVGHDMGSGQIAPNEPIVFDLFPRDKATGCYADMTRTYVVGEPSEEVKEWYRLVKEALDTSTAGVKPGVNGRKLYEEVCDIFHERRLQDPAPQGAGRGAGGRLLPRPRPRRRARGARAAVAGPDRPRPHSRATS